MSHASNPAVQERGTNRARPARKNKAKHPGGSVRLRLSDVVLEHYLKRVDPEVAAGFTEDQREAIKIMLGTRGVANHKVEIRRSVPFGRRRFYLVVLMGREHRALARLYGEGMVSGRFNALVYLGLAALLLTPLIGLLAIAGL